MNPSDENPDATSLNPLYSFDGPAIIPPQGTTPPPRSEAMFRRAADQVPGWEYTETESPAVVPPPGTFGRGRERIRRVNFSVGIPETQPATTDAVTELLRLVQGVVDGSATDPVKLDALKRAAAELARAG